MKAMKMKSVGMVDVKEAGLFLSWLAKHAGKAASNVVGKPLASEFLKGRTIVVRRSAEGTAVEVKGNSAFRIDRF